MATTTKVLSVANFKASRGITAINIYTSKKSGKRYATTVTGDFIGMLAEDCDLAKDIVVMSMLDDESGETWDFLCNGTEREPEATL